MNPGVIVLGTDADGLVVPVAAGVALFAHATPPSASAVTMHANRTFGSLTRSPRFSRLEPVDDYRRKSRRRATKSPTLRLDAGCDPPQTARAVRGDPSSVDRPVGSESVPASNSRGIVDQRQRRA